MPLREYPGYSISNLGQVRNDKRSTILSIVLLQSKHTYVCLMKNGVQVKRSISKLVSESFVPIPEHRVASTFTTPIHLDGDLTNCHADNLMWRPRWFAMKYTRQFQLKLPIAAPVRDIQSREVFKDLWPLVMTYGLLYLDIILSAANMTYVFPTMQTFEWAK